MLNVFSILPLLKGWDYKYNVWKRTLKRGESLEVERVSDTGVMLAMGLITDDAYGGFEITAQGGDLSPFTVSNVTPKSQFDQGVYVQDPAGWVSVYNQPNPQSTAGVFVLKVTSGTQGSSVPYVPTTVVKLYLTTSSTQAEATVALSVLRIIITDKKQFIRSLRAVLAMNMIQDIDPALLTAGIQEVTQIGVNDTAAKLKGEE
jgi:hypothetical protein